MMTDTQFRIIIEILSKICFSITGDKPVIEKPGQSYPSRLNEPEWVLKWEKGDA